MESIKKNILMLFLIAAIVTTFTGRYSILLDEFETEAHEKETQIIRYIELSRTFIELMTIYGDEYFEQSRDINSELYSLLKYDPEKDTFELDAVAGTKYEKTVGNLTGTGRIPDKGINRDELNLAFKYNEFFNDFYERLEGVQWLYYTSENDFINLYPWKPSKEFAYYDDIKNTEFYRFANPINNPQRKALWTPVYLDHAGKGLVVSLSSPVYNNGTFMGVVSLDIVTDKLSEIISTEYESYLIDVRNSVIATNSGIKSGDKPIDFGTVFKHNQIDPRGAVDAKNGIVYMSGGYYIHSVGFDKVPWRLFFLVPVGLIVYKAAIATLPLLIIGILLLFTVHEYDKVKRTEALLAHSIENLKSYQELLENAAKYDMLTNTYNRRGLKESFSKRIASASVDKTPISFIIIDIDYFKQFNDTFGHAAGDKVLVEISNIIKKNIKSDDILCRWGGEEFVIILFDRAYEEAMATAEKIRRKVEALTIHWGNSIELKGTMTLGVSEYNYIDSIDECVSKADSALYYGKENGRNQVNGYRDHETA